MLGLLDQRIKLLDIAIARRAKEDEVARRLMSIPGVGPVIATAMAALAPPAETFKRGRALRLGSGSRHCNIPPEENKGSARRRRWESERCDVCSSSARARWCVGRAKRSARGLVACEHDRTQASDAGESCIGEQNGPRHLGADGQRRDLPGSGRGVNLLTIVGLSEA